MPINAISTETKNAILRKSAYALPNRPSDQGMKPEDIKRAFWQPTTDATNSALTEIDRVISEANAIFSEQGGSISSHTGNTNNPHSVTKAQVGLSSVNNTSDENKPVSIAQQAALTAHNVAQDCHSDIRLSITNHTSATNNPHSVTKAQVGLGNCDNTSDIAKPVSTAQQAALDLKVNISDIKNNLTSSDTDKPVSALQAKNLKDSLDTMSPKVEASIKSLSLNSTTGVITITKTDNTSSTIDLPLEYLVKSGSYNSSTKKIELLLENNTKIEIPVGDLVNEYYGDGSTIELYTDSNDNNKLKFKVKASIITDITDNTTNRHSHSNKSLLDTYAQTETNLSAAVSKKHSHSNKTLLDSYTQTEDNLSDAVSKKHSHENATILNNTTASFTTLLATQISTNATNIGTLQSNVSDINNDIGAIDDALDAINGEVI
jgi:predicted  nucleic acid-binding Zn-ribbon protein